MVPFYELIQRKFTSISDHTNFSILIECLKREDLEEFYLSYYAHYSLKNEQWSFELRSTYGYSKETIISEKEEIERLISDISKEQREKKIKQLHALLEDFQFTYDYRWKNTSSFQNIIELTNASVEDKKITFHLYLGRNYEMNQMTIHFPIEYLPNSAYRAGYVFTFTANVIRTYFPQMLDFKDYFINKGPDRLKLMFKK